MNDPQNSKPNQSDAASSASDQDKQHQAADSSNEPTAASEIEADTMSEQSWTESADDQVSELESAQNEIAKLKDAFLRAKAEEDNIRRRAEKEVANSRKFAVEGFAKEMLNVYDSLKLAVAVQLADDADDAIKSVHEGVNITLKQLQSGLSKFSVTEIVPEVGDKLDPNLHQAMSLVESADIESGCVLTVIQSGFQLHDRLLRPAMVVVAK